MREKKGAMVRRRRISKEDMAARESAIIEDIKAGVLSYRQIAAKHGVSLPTVNNKARKAGISRGRRKGVRTVVRVVRRKTAKVARKAARKTTKKAARRRGRPAKAAPAIGAPVVRRRRKAVRKAGARRRVAVRRGRTPAASRAKGGFDGAFRKLVLKHYPRISLVKFEAMTKAVEVAVR
jgi:DNA-binding CsgD family transcriptional regulator